LPRTISANTELLLYGRGNCRQVGIFAATGLLNQPNSIALDFLVFFFRDYIHDSSIMQIL